MIFPLIGIVLGAALGLFRARGQGGNGKDMAHWALVFAIIGGILGLFLLLFIDRLM